MATIHLNREACASNGISLGEALLLLMYHCKEDLDKAQDLLIRSGYITAERDTLFQQTGWRLTNSGTTILHNVLTDSEVDDTMPSEQELQELAASLKAIFPTGKKLGTNNYWTEGVALIVKRLKLFFKKYGRNYTNDQIVAATREYVESFNGDYRFMRTLKYFILKEVRGADGTVESASDLLTRLDNAGQEDVDDWRDNVR